ncbi:hypothetical protein Gorai_016377 [Gossypium raimondii]|uniref:DUF4283 domain-containing protein n=1 Tax=Gossypium raimondii TaxID=29730 RepID=A0A7J8P8V5_GOSRA|nr:hypothetical protein [Gossypium raimondii]
MALVALSPFGDSDEFELMDGDITRSLINGIQPWTTDFNPVQPYSSVVKAWIRILGLSGFLYKIRMLEEIERLIRKVSKLDFNIDSRMRGKFTRMAVYVNLDKPLTSQVLVNNTLQRVEFESLSGMCFGLGHYDHLKEACPKDVIDLALMERKAR